MSDRPYSRLYHELADEYPDVYDSCDLAAYVRLLVAADQSWPSSARWAGYATEDEVGRLAGRGLVLLDGNRYRIKGMDKERKARSSAASNAAAARWANAASNADGNAASNADGNAETMPSQAKPSKAETSQAEQDAQTLWYDLKGGQVSEGALAFVRDLQDAFGDERLQDAMRAEAQTSTVDHKFLSRVKGRLLIDSERTQKAAEKRREDDELAYQRSLREGIENMTPEERERAERIKAGIKDFLGGVA